MAVVLVIVGVHASLVLGTVHARGNIWHDEAISLLSATGHQDEWAAIENEHAAPYGRWASAGEYSHLLEVDRPLDFQGVSRSVGDYDHHPPLFYWLLHLALVVGVPTLWAGPVVNLVTMGILALVAFRLVARVSGSVWLAALTVAAMVWSPAVIGSVAEALPYPLLALSLVGLAAACHHIALAGDAGTPLRRSELAAIGGVLVAGMLTHHQFVGFAALAFGVTWWLGGVRTRDRALPLAAVWAGAAAVTFAVFPYFFDHVAAVSSGTGFDPGLVAGRLSRWLTRAADVMVTRAAWDDVIRWVVRVVLVVTAVAVVVTRRRILVWVRSHRPAAVVVTTAVAIAAVLPTLYALQRTPEHAYGSRYAAFVWPLVLVGVAASGLGWRRGVVAVFAAVSLWSAADSMVATRGVGDQTRAMLAAVAEADSVLVDCVSRGYFPTIAWRLDADTRVLVGTGRDLAATIATDLDVPGERPVLLDAVCPDSADVLGALARGGFTADLLGSLERFTVYRVAPPAT